MMMLRDLWVRHALIMMLWVWESRHTYITL